MPKPLMLQRPSGLYVRFFVPSDLHARWGCRYIVRSLGGARADLARLAVARLGYALGQAFQQSRLSPMADPKDLLQTALAGARSGRDYTLELPNGVKITTDGSEVDYIKAKELAVELSAMAAPPAPTSLPSGLLSGRVQTFLSQMKAKDRSATNLLDTTFTLNLFVALIGDKELSAVNTDDLDTFLDALAVWPSNAGSTPFSRTVELRP